MRAGAVVDDRVAYDRDQSFRVVHGRLEPDTSAARELLSGPSAPAARRFLDGVGAYVAQRAASSNLAGMTFATSAASWNEARRAGAAAAGRPLKPNDLVRPDDDVSQGAQALDGWVTMGRVAAGVFQDVMRGTSTVEWQSKLARQLAHELEHTVSYPRPGAPPAPSPLLTEEGSVEFLAREGGGARLARSTGMTVDRQIIRASTSYTPQTRDAQTFVQRALGDGPWDFEQLDALLQRHPLPWPV